MDYYIDVVLKPDLEMRENVLLNKVYTKFHKALFSLQSNDIGVSFPNCQAKLGNIIRIHGSRERLHELSVSNWLGGLSGYCEMTVAVPLPDTVKGFRTVSRKQANMSLAKLRRLEKRGSITEAESKAYKARMYTQGLDNPFIELESGSNGNKHRRFIEFGALSSLPVAGKFDHFGLSRTATIPWF